METSANKEISGTTGKSALFNLKIKKPNSTSDFITSGIVKLSGFLMLLLMSAVQFNVFSQVKSEKTTFQTAGQWKPVTDVRGDVAIVYGTHDSKDMTFEQRVQSWRNRGYTVHFMTGIAWGDYQDYFTGAWDGKNHMGEGQVEANGDTIWHHKSVPYIVPTQSFVEYMKQKHIKRVIDAGIDAIYLEEPEFWARAGYSGAFKGAWKNYYGYDWRPPHESPENTYLANKLKYQMYYNALKEVFTFAKEYGKSKGMNVRCYVPTHSLVNYSAWRIVSPEASLASLPCVDGYIAQVWTGTARQKNFFNGVEKERVFENAFLEYGSMESMTAPTGRKMFFLTDPIEDRSRDWADYKRNYEATFTAQLLYPKIANYEIMPWPDRIYEGLYLNPSSGLKELIPRAYSTQMQIMVNALNEMPLSENKLDGAASFSVLMANSLMFQRFPTHEGYEDPQLSNFYGLAMPLLKRGIPVKIVHIENVGFPETLAETKVLVMTYSNMKPLEPEAHLHLANWVKKGGILVYCGRDNDPFQTVTEWWNSGKLHFKAPSQHLFEMLELDSQPADGLHKFGKGWVQIIRNDPKEFVLAEGGDKTFFSILKDLYEKNAGAGKIEIKNYFSLKRGPFELAAVMDEGIDNKLYVLNGLFVSLFDPALPVLTQKAINPGEQAFLYNLADLQNTKVPKIVAAAGRAENVKSEVNRYSFTLKSPLNTTNVMRVFLPGKPSQIEIKDSSGKPISEIFTEWDDLSHTCLLKFENHPDGISVQITW